MSKVIENICNHFTTNIRLGAGHNETDNYAEVLLMLLNTTELEDGEIDTISNLLCTRQRLLSTAINWGYSIRTINQYPDVSKYNWSRFMVNLINRMEDSSKSTFRSYNVNLLFENETHGLFKIFESKINNNHTKVYKLYSKKLLNKNI